MLCCTALHLMWRVRRQQVTLVEKVFQRPKGGRLSAVPWRQEIKQLSTLAGLSEDPSVVDLLKVEEQQPPITSTTDVEDSLIPIHWLIYCLGSQGVISRTCSSFVSPIWPVRKAGEEWRLAMGYCLNEVTTSLSAAVLDMLELLHELESEAAQWYHSGYH